ncbi:hypothetical protein MSHI_13810 [Mycobacterium shinjukuense]|uniref:Uncharacterized protein n=1 Tax=Mycobacterium shinjukuense TaxID=398694 RepID=A0A7I7MMP6_9MYCO|nr:hypothetical protein MSHI_13810 [Mycobacterium shinjukuense]
MNAIRSEVSTYANVQTWLSWRISMPGNTKIGPALTVADAIPEGSTAAAIDAVNADSAKRRTVDSDPSRPA